MPLSANGELQVECVERKLSCTVVTAISSSPLARAKQTVDIIGRRTGVRPHTEVDLTDLDCGKWEGLPSAASCLVAQRVLQGLVPLHEQARSGGKAHSVGAVGQRARSRPVSSSLPPAAALEGRDPQLLRLSLHQQLPRRQEHPHQGHQANGLWLPQSPELQTENHAL